MKKQQIHAFDGQGVNLCKLKQLFTFNPGETPINIEVSDDAVSSEKRGGPEINQRGIKDCVIAHCLSLTFFSL